MEIIKIMLIKLMEIIKKKMLIILKMQLIKYNKKQIRI
jgi:hypothetical protein